VFSQPVFHGLEMAATDHVPGASRVPTLALRLVTRSLYVCFTTTVAVLMPFFTDIIGLVGALVFWPAAVYYPVRLYCKLYRPRRTVFVLMQVMNVVAAVTSLLAVIGASWNIKQHVSHFTFSWLKESHHG
jgi:proton-coupled amino acid transporter